MRKLLVAIILVFGIFFTPFHSFSQNSKSKSYKPKTVRVKSYTTKKGKHVKSHYRSKPSKRKHTYIIPIRKPEELVA